MTDRAESASTSCESWARLMGQRRRQRDEDSAARAQSRAVDESDRREQCLQRWPGILSAIRSLVAAYNDGAGVDVLTFAERSDDDPAVTIVSPHSARGSVTVAVDEGDLCVRMNGHSPCTASMHGGVRRIDCSRSDMATAAYLLQDWMDQV